LALAAGERAGFAGPELLDAEDVGGPPDPLVDVLLGHLAQLQTEGQVLVDGPVLGGHVVDDRSPIRIVPLVISSSPATIRSAVVLPHPEGPTSTMISPSRMSRVRPETATVPSG
jgi:hypothetical protein